ncbi:MAG: hypothetical protein DRR16_31075 [Candidatus Parabeggiatoa sp. nov. 3]|nr:MAG: hypothetical protein DRR00_21470 [Gammaproteobacteria bacterium]RKZ55029.1 MAG: hypothetical protein DRQ99_30530 [Gammaproteobacteria bacterium]RKZ75653.1 MAG: hypothetical protein DRR16_31075 [Gammaproteobacteria bacterium]
MFKSNLDHYRFPSIILSATFFVPSLFCLDAIGVQNLFCVLTRWNFRSKFILRFNSKFSLIITDFGEALISKHEIWFGCFLTSHFGLIHYFIYGF